MGPADRAVSAWRGLFAAHANGVELPAGTSTAREVANDEDVAAALMHVAITVDMLLTGTALPPGQAEFAMQLLLLARDYVKPLPPDAGPALRADLEDLLGTLRAGESAREQIEAESLGARLLAQPGVEHVEEAIRVLTRALELTPGDDPRWAAIAGNLASAYSRRTFVDEMENWEAARDLLERACEAADRTVDPRTWAANHTNFAYLLSERPGGEAGDLERAIGHVRAALEERSPERDAVDWAYSQLHLGLFHRRRGAEGDRARAEGCYRDALTHLRAKDDPQLWAALQNNLADLLLSAPIDLSGAEASAVAGLSVTDEEEDPITAGRLVWLLARIEEQRAGQLAPETVRLRSRALRLLRPGLAPSLHLRVGGELVDAYAKLGNWQAAADTYEEMLTAFDIRYDAQVSAEGRRRVLADSPRLARWAAYVLAHVGRTAKAVGVIEQGRARELGTSARRGTADLARLAAVDRQLVGRYETALAERCAALQEAGRADAVTPHHAARRVSAAERRVRQVVNEIRDVPSFDRFLRPMTPSDIVEAADRLPVVYLVSAPGGSYVLTVRPGPDSDAQVDGVHVPDVTCRSVTSVVLFDADDGRPGLLTAQSDVSRMRALLPAALERLGELKPLLDPVARILAEDSAHGAIVVTTGMLGLAPLHAVQVTGGHVLDEVGEVRLAPSAAVYAACRSRAAKPRQPQLVGVANTDPNRPLPGSEAELAAVGRLFEGAGHPTTCAVGPTATRSWLLDHAEDASHLHLACHGGAGLTDPLGGTLQMGNGTRLTMSDLEDRRLPNCRVAVASACQSGHYETGSVPDEFLGLPAGLLQAGAACAVTSLWQVNDLATAILMTRFYELLDPTTSTEQQLPVVALRAARSWLRGLSRQQADDFIGAHPELAAKLRQVDHPVYSSPACWATFTVHGC